MKLIFRNHKPAFPEVMGRMLDYCGNVVFGYHCLLQPRVSTRWLKYGAKIEENPRVNLQGPFVICIYPYFTMTLLLPTQGYYVVQLKWMGDQKENITSLHFVTTAHCFNIHNEVDFHVTTHAKAIEKHWGHTVLLQLMSLFHRSCRNIYIGVFHKGVSDSKPLLSSLALDIQKRFCHRQMRHFSVYMFLPASSSRSTGG